jgi:long-chain acyl-CoA synthetase
MSEYFGVKVEDLFNTMPDRFRPEGAEGIDASFGYDIAEEGKWKLTVKDRKMKVEKTPNLSGCVTVTTTDGETFVGINLGKVDSMKAFSSGKFKVEGDFGALAKTGKMFRKYVPPKKELTPKEYILDMFGTLEKRFQPARAEGLDVSIGYDIGGQDGGKWTVIIQGGKCVVKEGLAENLSVKLQAQAPDWVALMLGKIDALSLLSAGKAAIAGDAKLALRLGEIFSPYAPPGEKAAEQELIVLRKTISVNQKFATGPVMGKFLKALKEKKIMANQCPQCGRLQLPPREVCAPCLVRATEWKEVGPKGHLMVMDVVYYASPDPLTGETRETPYGSIHVLLDGCKGHETFWHLLRRDQIFRVKEAWGEERGTRLRPVWAEQRTGNIHDIQYFEIDE